MSRKKRLLLYIPCTIAGLAIASLLLFVFLLDLNNYKDYFEKKMADALHRPVSIGSVESMLYKGLQIRFNDFRVTEQADQPYYLKADHLDIKIHLLSILKKRIFIKRIELEGPTLYVVRKPRVAGEGGGKSNADLMKTATSGASNMELLVRDFHVYQGKLVFLDETLDDGSVTLELNDVNLLVQDLFWFTPPSLRLTGVLSRQSDGGHESDLNVRLQFLKRPVEASIRETPFSATVRLNNFNLSDYLPYFERLGFLKDVNALLDLDLDLSGSLAEGVTAEGLINFGDLRIGSANREGGPISPQEASAKFSLVMDRSSIKFDTLVLDWDDIELSGALALENYDTPDLKVIARFDSRPFEFSDVKGFLAQGKLPAGIDKFLNAVTRAQVRLSGVRIDGSLQELRDWGNGGGKPPVSGSVAITNMDMVVGKAKLPIKGIHLVLSLDGDDLGFEITQGMFRKTRLKEVRGKVTNLFGKPLLTADISASVELADLKELLDLKGEMDVPGFMGRTERLYGDGELSLSLMKKIPGGPTTLKGEIELSGVFISHPRFPLPLSDVTGKVSFTNDAFGFENLRGFFGASPFRITLTSFNFRDADPPLSLQGNMSLNREDLADLLPAWLTDRVDFEGSADMVFRLSGSKQSMDIQTDFDLKDFSYRYNNFYKPLAADGSVKFEAHLVPSNILTIKKLSITHADMTADAKGNIFLAGPILDLQLRSDDFDIKYLAEFFPRFLTYNPRGGKGSIQFGFTGKPGAIKTRGMVLVEGITADFPVLPRSLYLANAKITYREGLYTWEVDEVITGKSRFYTRGSYRKGAPIPLSMDYKFSSLYVEDISNGNHRNGVEKSENEEQTDRTDGHLNDRSVEDTALRRRAGMFLYPFSADIEAENFFINGVRLWALRTRLESGNGYWNFKDLMFNLAGGKFNGGLMVNGLSPSGSEFDMMIDLIGVDLEKLIGQIRPETDILSGTLSLKGQIQGDKLTLEGLRKSVNGRIVLRLNDGFIKKFKVLAAISRLLNFPQLIASTGKEGSGLGKGLPYRSITGGLDFNEGIMYTDNLLMDGPSVKMSSVGSVDFVAKKYDMTVALQPLGDLGNMVGKIPLVGKLIAGSDSSLTTTFFKVGGEFGNPKPEITK